MRRRAPPKCRARESGSRRAGAPGTLSREHRAGTPPPERRPGARLRGHCFCADTVSRTLRFTDTAEGALPRPSWHPATLFTSKTIVHAVEKVGALTLPQPPLTVQNVQSPGHCSVL